MSVTRCLVNGADRGDWFFCAKIHKLTPRAHRGSRAPPPVELPRPGSEAAGTGRFTTPPACVRACGRACAGSDLADPASRDVAQLACAASPRDRAHLGRPPAKGGRAERRVTAMKTHVRTYIRARVVLGSRPDLRDVPRLARARPPRVTELTAQQRT